MGALYGEQSMIDRESWSDMVSNDFNIGLWAGVSAAMSARRTFQSYTEEEPTYSRGRGDYSRDYREGGDYSSDYYTPYGETSTRD